MSGAATAMISADPSGGVRVLVKVVPGARRDEIVCRLGNRLKVRVSAPPEGGKANAAIARLLAAALGVRPRDAEVITGHGSPDKTVRVAGVTPENATAALKMDA